MSQSMFKLPDRSTGSGSTAVRRSLKVGLAFLLMAAGSVATGAKPEIDPSYAEGKLYYMIGPHLIPNAINTQPNLYAHAEELYLLVYPINPSGTDTDPKALPSGYHPNCDPCYHPGVPGIFAYHDHVLTGAPGLGKDGTAGVYKGPWKIILLMYNPEVISEPNFKPIMSARDVDAGEANGTFLPINNDLSHGSNPFEFETGNVLICPLVSPTA